MEYKHVEACWKAVKECKTVTGLKSIFKTFPQWSGDWEVLKGKGTITVCNFYYDESLKDNFEDKEDVDVIDDEDIVNTKEEDLRTNIDCPFEMKVYSRKKESLDELIKILNYTKGSKYNLSRIFDAWWGDQPELVTEAKVGEYYNGYIFGNCAGSVTSCMMEGKGTYFDDDPEGIMDNGAIRTSLPRICKRLKIAAEIYSMQYSSGFQEHYVINNQGEIIIEEDKENIRMLYKDDVEEYNKEFGTSIDKEEFDEGDYLVMGGFDKKGGENFEYLAPTLAILRPMEVKDVVENYIKSVTNGEGETECQK